MLLLVMFPGLF